MDIGDIISDALVYPFQNIKALVIYVILGIIAGIAAGGTIMGMAVTASYENFAGTGITAIIGFVILIAISLLISGYTLDIVKFGIQRRADSPGIDLGRQIVNAIKLIIVGIVYFIIPVIISFVLGLFLRDWILTIIVLILTIVFSLAEFMAKCRLAKTEDLGSALAIGEAIGDISRVGIGKLLATVIIIFIVMIVISIIIGMIANYHATIGGILMGIFGVYAVFFYNRAVGLLYSNV